MIKPINQLCAAFMGFVYERMVLSKINKKVKNISPIKTLELTEILAQKADLRI